MQIKANEIKFVKPEELKPHPINPNHHSEEQIERLCELIKYQGFRSPIVVSNLSGCIVHGHGRAMAATKLGMKTVPVIYQDFQNEDQEYASMVSDNAISSWADLDLSMINLNLPSLGPDFNVDMLGIENFKLDSFDDFEEEIKENSDQFIVSIHCKDETEMSILFDEMQRRGFECKLIR